MSVASLGGPSPKQTVGAAPSKASFRVDIQALRGIAVLLVVFYHSGLGIFPAGYLGVDLFFVISGFLITGIVARQIGEDRFSFIDFYSRRVRRLLPAAYVTLAFTSIAAAWLLSTKEYHAYLINLAGAVSFSANLTLWSQVNYFAPDSSYQPLLHMWSLAIEEQYYLLLPIVLFFLPRRLWLGALVVATALSLAGSLYLTQLKPSVAFFWMPFRAWELGIGSIAALIWRSETARRGARALFPLGIGAIGISAIFQLPGPAPSVGAMLISFGGLIIILAQSERVERWAPARWLARVGDFSYSLYLVHWPLFALVRATQLSHDLAPLLAVSLIALSCGLAWLLYFYVEEPLRRAPIARLNLFASAVIGSAAVLALGWSLGEAKTLVPGADQLEHPVNGLEQACLNDVTEFDGRCSQSPKPEVLLWGDSYSAHLVPGIVATSQHAFVQASKGKCSPFSNYAAVATVNEREWTRGCLAFNASVIAWARRTPSLKVVILSSSYARGLPSKSIYALRAASDGTVVRAPLGVAALIKAQSETMVVLRSIGLRVVIVSAPPPSPFNLGACWLRKAEGIPMTGPFRECRLVEPNAERSSQRFDELMTGFAQRSSVPVIDLEQALCSNRQCLIEAGGKPLFRDEAHFTPWGSQFVGKRLNLGARAWAVAR